MFGSKARLQALEKRVSQLERGMAVRVYDPDEMFFYSYQPIREVLQAILTYFGLKLVRQPARSAGLTCEPADATVDTITK
jgi:hypothetical protein